MAKAAKGAHLRDAKPAAASHMRPDPADENPYLAAAREADRNNRMVSLACIVLVVIIGAFAGSRHVIGRMGQEEPAAADVTEGPVVEASSFLLGQLSTGFFRQEVVEAEEAVTEAIWEADPENIHTGADAVLETVTSGQGVTTIAPVGFSQTGAAAQLDQAIADFEARGYVLGIALVDVTTGRAISYNADEPRYPASSIKAAFCTYVLEGNGLVSEGLVRTCIIDSSNDAYHALIRAYGQQGFSEWLAPMAPNAAGNAAAHYYPWISPSEFLAVWQEIYRFGTSDEPGAAELAGFLGRTTTTAWGELFRGEWEVWAKAGWYPSTIERATCDCGVVFSDCGPYIVVVMSDAPEDFEALKPVLDALNVAHGKMCGGSTESRL